MNDLRIGATQVRNACVALFFGDDSDKDASQADKCRLMVDSNLPL
jgi:hypothetical protein